MMKFATNLNFKDEVGKVLGMFSLHKLFKDWCLADPDEAERKKAKWKDFVNLLQTYRKGNFEALPIYRLDANE